MDNAKTDSGLVLLKGGQGEYEEKKSRFIATVEKCGSEAEAAAFIEAVRKRYWDARHNCYAFRVGERGEITRCSDDGEPGGTAGRPMLEVLLGAGVRDAAVVVTRYFGGVLLGTGGLVRAYTRAVQEGLRNCTFGRLCFGAQIRVTTDYHGIGKILYLLRNAGMEPVGTEYTDKASLLLEIPAERVEDIRGKMVEVTQGKVEFEKIKEVYFVDKEQPGGI